LSKLFGFGDYATSIKGNSLMAGVAGNSVPKFQGDGKRGVRLTEREFLGNIVTGPLVSGSSVFTNSGYPIIPTNPVTFPWLSKIANLFDQWDPHGIVFEFHTTSSTFNGTSQALGAVIMATDYDVNDPLYGSKQVMENADYACSTVPSSNLLHGIECDPRERPLDIMYTTPRPSQLNFSTMGNFQIASQGCSTAGTTLGELWVSYDITFYKKQLVSAVADSAYINFSGASQVGGPLLLPTSTYASQGVGLTQIVGTGTDIILPPSQTFGSYLYTLSNTSVQTADQAAPVVTNGTVSQIVSSTGLAALSVITGVITITGPNCVARWGLKSTTAATTIFTLSEVPPSFRVI
jgi:hypothetical protein